MHPATARSQDPGTAVLTGEGAAASLTLGTMETVNKTELNEEAVVGLRRHKLWGWRETAKVVVAAETVWQEQACPRLRITAGSSESTSPLPCVIVSLRDSSQCHSGEIQRETLSKITGGSSKLWPALTKRDFGIWGKGEYMENRCSRAWYCSVGTTQKLF